MSMMAPRTNGTPEIGQTVASFPEYEAAQKAVSKLIAAEVPARDIAIVGTALRSVEKVTGKLGYASAARSGAMNGVLIGLFFSAILVLGSPAVPIQAFVGVIFVGIAVGMLLSIISYAIVRRRRDFASVMQVVADHYEVTVLSASAQKARQVLGGQPEPAPSAAPQPSGPLAPPQYGERITPAEDDPQAPPRYGERIPPRPADPVDSAEEGAPPAREPGEQQAPADRPAGERPPEYGVRQAPAGEEAAREPEAASTDGDENASPPGDNHDARPGEQGRADEADDDAAGEGPREPRP